jgi:hypothetical protein
MFVTKKHLSRRTFLRGAGATIALPFLSAMVPARTALSQTAAAVPHRYGFVYVPMGTIMKEWMPAQVGADFEFSPILKGFEPFRDKVTVISGLYNPGANGHSPSSGTFLSGAFPARGSTILLNTTVDQMVAQKIGQDTTFPSMEFATEDHSEHLGSCAGDFLCSYMSTVSWRTPTQPLPMEINPRVVFETMFGGAQATAEARRARLDQSTSILDRVAESTRALQRDLGAGDQAKLSEYMENVREIERRIVRGERQRSEANLEAPPTPVGVPENWEEHVDLLWELGALAFQGDLTRVITFMLSAELSTRSYPNIGVADGHHPISHNNFVPEQMAKKAKVDAYHVERCAKFLHRLESIPAGDGTSLLDNFTFFYGSGMSNSNAHDHLNLPTVVVSSRLGGNRHIKAGVESETRDNEVLPKFDVMTKASNLHLAIIQSAGVEIDSYGVGDATSDGVLDFSI